MEFQQLEQFRVLARIQHMTKAADALYISQPALSQSIKRLEDELGAPLFDRPGRQICLNQCGRVFLKRIEQAFFALEEGQRHVRDLARLDQGEVSLASAALHWLAEPLQAFLGDHRAVQFRLFQLSVPQMQQRLEAGKIDFGLAPAPLKAPSFQWCHLLTEEVYLLVPRTHRLAGWKSVPLGELASEAMLFGRPGCYLRDFMEPACRDAGFTPRIVCEADEAAISDLVKAGVGIAFTHTRQGPYSAGAGLSGVRVTHPARFLTLGIVWSEAHYLGGAARAFQDFLLSYFATSRSETRPVLVPE